VAGSPGYGGETAADADREAVAPVLDRADEGDAVDLGRVAAVGARGDRVLVLARQVREVGVAVEEVRGLLDDGRGVEQLVRVEARDGAAGDVANGVPAAA